MTSKEPVPSPEGASASPPPVQKPELENEPSVQNIAVNAISLPDFAGKADDLEALKKSVDDAASVGGGLWLSYLLALFYLTIAAASVSHADLFFEKPINLLLLNVQLPIAAFFGLAPALFIALHGYTLAHLVMLTEKAKRFHIALYEQIGETASLSGGEKSKRKRIRDALRAQLPSNVFVQFLAGPPEMRQGSFGFVLRSIGWVTLVFGPVLLLLLLQLQFLPYHSAQITWVHRIALVADLILVWWLWGRILTGREYSDGLAPRRRSLVKTIVGIVVTFLIVVFAFAIATFRGEGISRAIAFVDAAHAIQRLHDAAFQSNVQPNAVRPRWPLSDALVLTQVNALDELKIEDPEKAKWKDYIFLAEDRDLTGADFQNANLARISFARSFLSGARFQSTQMDRVSLEGAHMSDARFVSVYLRGALMRDVFLSGAYFYQVEAQGSDLEGAHLEFVYFSKTNFAGASLLKAKLQASNFMDTILSGASLEQAELQAAIFSSATIRGTTLRRSSLEGAHFEDGSLEEADLSRADLWRSYGERSLPIKTLFVDEVDEEAGVFVEGSQRRWSDVYSYIEGNLDRLVQQGDMAVEKRKRVQSMLESIGCSEASCGVVQSASDKFKDWYDRLVEKKLTEDDFQKALEAQLRDLVCSGVEGASNIVEGAGFFRNLDRAKAVSLIEDLRDKLGKNCLIASLLSDAERARLANLEAQVKSR